MVALLFLRGASSGLLLPQNIIIFLGMWTPAGLVTGVLAGGSKKWLRNRLHFPARDAHPQEAKRKGAGGFGAVPCPRGGVGPSRGDSGVWAPRTAAACGSVIQHLPYPRRKNKSRNVRHKHRAQDTCDTALCDSLPTLYSCTTSATTLHAKLLSRPYAPVPAL